MVSYWRSGLSRCQRIFVSYGAFKRNLQPGGEKISAREIDDALLDHPDILQAAVFAIPHPTLGETVAAAVVIRDSQMTESKIREYLTERLADFKMPARMLIVDDIPRTSNGQNTSGGPGRDFAERTQVGFRGSEK